MAASGCENSAEEGRNEYVQMRKGWWRKRFFFQDAVQESYLSLMECLLLEMELPNFSYQICLPRNLLDAFSWGNEIINQRPKDHEETKCRKNGLPKNSSDHLDFDSMGPHRIWYDPLNLTAFFLYIEWNGLMMISHNIDELWIKYIERKPPLNKIKQR